MVTRMDVFSVGGGVALVIGAWQYSPTAAWLTGGGVLLVFALLEAVFLLSARR